MVFMRCVSLQFLVVDVENTKAATGHATPLVAAFGWCYRAILMRFQFFPYSPRDPCSVSRGSRTMILVQASCMKPSLISCRGDHRMHSWKSRLVTEPAQEAKASWCFSLAYWFC